jgi:hypothetical protein
VTVIEGERRQRGSSLAIGVAVIHIMTQAWLSDKRKEGAAATVVTVFPLIGFSAGFFIFLFFPFIHKFARRRGFPSAREIRNLGECGLRPAPNQSHIMTLHKILRKSFSYMWFTLREILSTETNLLSDAEIGIA